MLTEPIAVTLMVVDVFIHKENAFEQSQFKRRASQAISTQPERATYVAEQWGRRWITIDTSRVAIALARTRLMSGRYPYYLLADSAEGRRKEAELTGQWASDDGPQTSD